MAEASESPLVLVTGASGYIATHIVKQLQEEGYKVRGTVRSLEGNEKLKPLRELCPEAQHALELVEADLTKPESWEAAVKDCVYVIHTATPNPSQNPENEDDVVKPAVEGTTSILKACQSTKSVKRVVLTSSLVAISGGFNSGEADKTYTEEDWADTEKAGANVKSKTLSEKAAWDFVKELPEEEKFELAVVNPSYVMGPVLSASVCSSMEVPKRLLERAMPAVPRINFPIIDVRDVAAAHIKAMTTPEAAGQRHILYNTSLWMKEIAQVISKEFKPQGYSVPTMNCPYFALWMKSLFDKTLKSTLPNVGKVIKVDNTRMKETLGITPHDINTTINEMCYSLIEGGFVKKAKKYGAGKKPGEEDAQENQVEGEKAEEEGETKKDEEKKDEPKENGDVKEEEKEKADEKKEEKNEEEKSEKEGEKEGEKEEKADEKKEETEAEK